MWGCGGAGERCGCAGVQGGGLRSTQSVRVAVCEATCFPATYGHSPGMRLQPPASLCCSTICKVSRTGLWRQRPPSHVTVSSLQSYLMGNLDRVGLALREKACHPQIPPQERQDSPGLRTASLYLSRGSGNKAADAECAHKGAGFVGLFGIVISVAGQS